MNSPTALTADGLLRMLENEEGHVAALYLQVFQIEALKDKDKYSCYVSDGHYMVKAFVNADSSLAIGRDQFAIINVHQYICLGNKKLIGLTNFELVKTAKISSRLGNPKNVQHFANVLQSIERSRQTVMLPIQAVLSQTKSINEVSNSFNDLKLQYTSPQKIHEQKVAKSTTQYKSAKTSLGEYSSVGDLFLDCRRYLLLVRLVSKKFDEVMSTKKKQKIKILNLQLMDQYNKKISAVGYGQLAEIFNDKLILNEVYQVSNCSIGNESYAKAKIQNQSSLRLTINENSVFQPVCDISTIGTSQDAALTLGNVAETGLKGQSYDIIAVLAHFGETTAYTNKDSDTFNIRKIIIADPIDKVKAKVALWRSTIDAVKPEQIGNVFVFSKFSFKQYNGSITFSSTYKSSISVFKGNHPFKRMTLDINEYRELSEVKYNNEDQLGIPPCKTISEINDKAQLLPSFGTMNEGGHSPSLRGDLDVYINRFNWKKWFYDGCPNCRNAMDKMSVCRNCNQYSEKTIPHYILGIELVDYTGSLWITAYDQFGENIFGKGAIEEIKDKSVDQLKNYAEKNLYSEWKLRIYTKRKEGGGFTYNIGKIVDQKNALDLNLTANLDRIRAHTNKFMAIENL